MFSAHFPEKKDRLVIAGMLAGVQEGDRLDIEGEEVFHPRFGRQVKVHSFCPYIPGDLDGLKTFLASGRFKGVGEKTAQKLIDSFGAELAVVLEKEPDRLAQIRGINKKVIDSLVEEYRALRDQRELMIKLAPFAIGQETLYRILAVYGHQAMVVLEANPYRLMSEVKGIGFRTADAIGRAMGFANQHPLRIQSALLWLLEQLEQRQGDMAFPLADLQHTAQKQFDLPQAVVQEHLQALVDRNVLIRFDKPFAGVSRPICYWTEKSIAEKLAAMIARPACGDLAVGGLDGPGAEALTENQARAVDLAFQSPLQIVTGGPGTGKTTIIKQIVLRCLRGDLAVAVAAPTGRAAKRIEEASGYQASTIHRLLKIDPESGAFVHGDSNPLDFAMVIIDEFSMVDAFLFSALLRALKPDSHLVLIGDKDQLPSVGPGNVIRDLIGSGMFPTSVLTHNFRQEQAASLIYLADCIQAGRADRFLRACQSEQEQFRFVRADSEVEAQQSVLTELADLLERLPVSSLDYQVLSPMYRGEAGVEQLNLRIQERFNQRQLVLTLPGRDFRIGDRVMQLRNNYELEIFNGEQGIVCDYQTQRRLLRVDFGERIVELSHEQLDDIVLSYASTVHKAQGAEFQEIIICLLPGHGLMLNRELLYTAFTRARRRVVIVGSAQALAQAINQAMPRFRRTLLGERLQEAQKKP